MPRLSHKKGAECSCKSMEDTKTAGTKLTWCSTIGVGAHLKGVMPLARAWLELVPSHHPRGATRGCGPMMSLDRCLELSIA
eukprot:5652527-Alexandrium_andersonii.AAC.1